MLTNDAKIVLDYIRKANRCSNTGYVQIHKHKGINAFDTMNYDQVSRTLTYLENEKYITILKETNENRWFIRLEHRGEHYEEFEQNEAQINSNHNSTNINIHGNVTGSAIGNVGITRIDNGITYEGVCEIIRAETLSTEDKEQLLEMIELFKKRIEKRKPLKYKFLSKFRTIVKKCSEKALNAIIDFLGIQVIQFFLG